MKTAIDIAYNILKQHGHEDWIIRVTESGGASCHIESKQIWIDQHSKDDIYLLLHEIAHIKHSDHDREWADRFTCLCQRHIGWAVPLANWSDDVTLAISKWDAGRMQALKKEWIDFLCDWPWWNVAPEYTRDHYRVNLAANCQEMLDGCTGNAR